MLSSPKEGKSLRASLGALLLEVFLIILGVMVALGANEWREARAIAKRTDLALENIRREIERNYETMQLRAPYHEAMRDSIHTNYPKIKDAAFEDLNVASLGLRRGPFFPLLYNTAWQTALNSQILPHVDYETLSLLSSIYQIQEDLKATEEQFSTILFSPDNMQKGRPYYAFMLSEPFITGLASNERALLELYEQALLRLNPEGYTLDADGMSLGD